MNEPVLLIIDVQKGLDEPALGERNNPGAESNMAALLAAWRERGLPVVHVRHCSTSPASPLRPELPGNAYKDEVRPRAGEPEFTKTVNSAFIGTGLEGYLRERGLASIVMVGLTTDHCVSTSARMAGNLGFDVTLVGDATATFDRAGPHGSRISAQAMHDAHLASLDGEFCTVRTSAEVLRDVAGAGERAAS